MVLTRTSTGRPATRNKRNLMIFLRPMILRDDAAGELLSNDKYNLLRLEQTQSAARYDRPVRGGDPMLLPALPAPVPPATPAEAQP